MRSIVWLSLAAALLLNAAGAVRANDGAAETAAGGLVFKQNEDVDMVSEDLFISARQVRVRYVFRNRAPRDVRVTVAFPLPDLPLPEAGEGDRGWPQDFSTRVDGRPIRMQVERKAFARGVDQTALLQSMGITVPGLQQGLWQGADEALDRLTPAQLQQLESVGLIESYEDTSNGNRLLHDPIWTVRETWYWDQVFPAGRDVVVEHSYTPGLGGIVTTALASPEYRSGENGRAQIALYCIDGAFLAAVDRAARQQRTEYPMIPENWLTYILTTGATWRSPIADFRLVVDKGDPRNLVSFCGEGVRRISPTQFELRRRNWRPTEDLHVLFLRPNANDE